MNHVNEDDIIDLSSTNQRLYSSAKRLDSHTEVIMYCTNCGQYLPDDSRFCYDCGALQQPAATPRQVAPIQNQAHSGITCPRCHSTNVNVQVINQVQLQNVHHGCAWWLFVGWWWIPVKWIFFTVPALIIKLFKPKKQRIVNHMHSTAVCQNCGHNWRV